MASAVTEAIWLQGLMIELGEKHCPIEIYEDNQSCIETVCRPRQHQRMKHLDVKYSFLHENVNSKNISITYIPTEEQVADIFTKSLPPSKFEFLKSKLKLI